MSATHEPHLNNWWAQGDTPVHDDSRVAYFVDAHSTFLMMCRQFLMAHKYLYIAAWGMTPLMKLVRGTDQRAGPDGSPQQEALLAELRAEGLEEPEIDFWCTHELTVSRSEEHTSELQSPCNLVCRLLLEKKKKKLYILYFVKKKEKKKNN